jgi:chaperonin GroES
MILSLNGTAAKPTVCPLTPMDDYVICERCESDDAKLKLALPENLRKPSNRGVIVAVGPGRLMQSGQYAPLPLKVGEEVVFAGFLKEDAGLEFDGHKYLIVQAGDIVAKVNP